MNGIYAAFMLESKNYESCREVWAARNKDWMNTKRDAFLIFTLHTEQECYTLGNKAKKYTHNISMHTASSSS